MIDRYTLTIFKFYISTECLGILDFSFLEIPAVLSFKIIFPFIDFLCKFFYKIYTNMQEVFKRYATIKIILVCTYNSFFEIFYCKMISPVIWKNNLLAENIFMQDTIKFMLLYVETFCNSFMDIGIHYF